MPDTLHVKIRIEDGAYWATTDQYPGVFATGDNLDELRESLAEGIALYVADPGETPPAIELGELHLPVVETASDVALTLA